MSDAKKRYEELRARDQALYEKVNDLLSRAREIISQTDSLEESELDRKISEIYFEIIGLNSDYKKLVELRITMIPR